MVYEERTVAREEFRNRNPRRAGQRLAPYPAELEEVPAFAQWIQREVESDKERGIQIPDDVEDSSKPPSLPVGTKV